MENVMKGLVDMQYQLEESQKSGELEQFIQDQHKDLYRLLTICMHALHQKEFQAA